MMLKQRVEAARAVSASLRPAEASIEIAAMDAARVVTTMMEARRSIGLTAHVGFEPLEMAGRAAALVLEAQRILHDAHVALGPVVASVGLSGREHMFGCEEPPAPGPGQSITKIIFGEEPSRPTAEARAG